MNSSQTTTTKSYSQNLGSAMDPQSHGLFLQHEVLTNMTQNTERERELKLTVAQLK